MLEYYTVECPPKALIFLLPYLFLQQEALSYETYDPRTYRFPGEDFHGEPRDYENIEDFRRDLVEHKVIPTDALCGVRIGMFERGLTMICFNEGESCRKISRSMAKIYILERYIESAIAIMHSTPVAHNPPYFIPKFLYERYMKDNRANTLRFNHFCINLSIPSLLKLSNEVVKKTYEYATLRALIDEQELPKQINMCLKSEYKIEDSNNILEVNDIFVGGLFDTSELFDTRSASNSFTPQYSIMSKHIAASPELQELLRDPFNRNMFNAMNFHEQIKHTDPATEIAKATSVQLASKKHCCCTIS